MRNYAPAPSRVAANSYIVTDPKKREHVAADPVEIDRILADMRKQFGASFKFKIRVNRDTQTTAQGRTAARE